MSRRALARLWATVLAAAVIILARNAGAHPAGFTSVNRYVGVQCAGPSRVHIAYLLDFAEFPAYAEIETLDADHDGTVTPSEQRAYLDGRLPPLLAQWTVEVNGKKTSLRLVGSSLEAAPGERGLSTLRIAADIDVDAASAGVGTGAEMRVLVRDPTFSDRSGWREMAAEDTPEAVVVSGVSARPGDALAYSSRAAMAPPRLDEASFTFRLREASGVRPLGSQSGPAVVIDARIARLSSTMKRARGSWSFSVLAMALAFALGAAHALSPGHGKVMAAAYLVGRRARLHHAVLFGSSVTIAHTAVVFLVGCLALALERMIGSDRLLRGLELAAAVAIVALGIAQLSRRWREAVNASAVHDHAHPGLHRGADEKSEGARSLMALGVSSGLTPCPSALAVLLTAISLHRYGFGLILVFAFSLGVALTLTATGVLVLTARTLLDRISGASPILRWLPVMSSSCVLLIGVLLFASAWSPG